jgi:glycerol-3-phosphate dehydrogenase
VLTFWDEQGRIFYVIPMHDRSVIGTTDTRVLDPLEEVTDQDREFVLRQINLSMTLDKPLTVDDIISER